VEQVQKEFAYFNQWRVHDNKSSKRGSFRRGSVISGSSGSYTNKFNKIVNKSFHSRGSSNEGINVNPFMAPIDKINKRQQDSSEGSDMSLGYLQGG
jgi:hypothetical protein